ncbi:Lysine-specific metallo-endopeptidase [Rhizoctonia solani]|uniref:Lysine-specific metallo-endopeptidase n=1 Tax=Rhizoctonia solani TaxID=456999 RepID=A0A8H7ICY5_9AGAM|nr:Lysine-specific metallo-endopeptidase [Rhizoctonia solani]
MLATITFTLSIALIASAARSLSLNVVASSTEVTDIDNFHVNATLSNTGSETLRLLRDPRSPLSTWATETFGVINSKGARAEFSGIKVRYDPQAVTKAGRPDSFVELNPGESVTVKHDLAGVYNLTLTGTGTYTVDAANLFRVVEGNNTLTDIYADIITAKVKIQNWIGQALSFKNAAATPVVSLLSDTEYSGCTANQQGEIAVPLNPHGDMLPRLRTYPGGWTYDCGTCTEPDAYAYVYPSRYGVVYLCSAFWSAPETGAASKADTIIHEGTHFPPVIGTSDYAYGQSNCLALARSNPTNAVYNADNHAFFSVDTEIR